MLGIGFRQRVLTIVLLIKVEVCSITDWLCSVSKFALWSLSLREVFIVMSWHAYCIYTFLSNRPPPKSIPWPTPRQAAPTLPQARAPLPPHHYPPICHRLPIECMPLRSWYAPGSLLLSTTPHLSVEASRRHWPYHLPVWPGPHPRRRTILAQHTACRDPPLHPRCPHQRLPSLSARTAHLYARTLFPQPFSPPSCSSPPSHTTLPLSQSHGVYHPSASNSLCHLPKVLHANTAHSGLNKSERLSLDIASSNCIICLLLVKYEFEDISGSCSA